MTSPGVSRPTHRRAAAAAQAGFGLVEMMVALTIALFVLAAMGALVLELGTTFRAQDGFARLQENQRLASTMLTTTLRSAGYFPDPLAQSAAEAMPAIEDGGYGALAAAQSVVGTAGIGGGTQTLTVRYVTAPNGRVLNCLGRDNTGTADEAQVNLFRVSAAGQTLDCSLDDGATWNPIVGGVSDMAVMYLVDRSVLGDRTSIQYLGAVDVASQSLWDRVVAARITLDFVNPMAAQPAQPATLPWVVQVNLMGRI